MLNTILCCLAAKRNSNPVPVFQAKPVDKTIFNRYFMYYVGHEYSEDDAKLISDVFQDSADEAGGLENIDIRCFQDTNYSSPTEVVIFSRKPLCILIEKSNSNTS